MTAIAPSRQLEALRASWRPARARTLLAVASLLEAVREEGALNTAAQSIGIAWGEAFGMSAVPEAVARQVEFSVLALGVDGLAVVRGVYDPYAPDSLKWNNDPAVLARLQEIAGQDGKRGKR